MLDRRQVHNVELIQANINDVSANEVSPHGPDDAVFCRAFLSHEPNLAHTLGRMASLIRPGGHIIAHEWLFGPHRPQSEPDVPELLRRTGGSTRFCSAREYRRTYPAITAGDTTGRFV